LVQHPGVLSAWGGQLNYSQETLLHGTAFSFLNDTKNLRGRG